MWCSNIGLNNPASNTILKTRSWSINVPEDDFSRLLRAHNSSVGRVCDASDTLTLLCVFTCPGGAEGSLFGGGRPGLPRPLQAGGGRVGEGAPAEGRQRGAERRRLKPLHAGPVLAGWCHPSQPMRAECSKRSRNGSRGYLQPSERLQITNKLCKFWRDEITLLPENANLLLLNMLDMIEFPNDDTSYMTCSCTDLSSVLVSWIFRGSYKVTCCCCCWRDTELISSHRNYFGKLLFFFFFFFKCRCDLTRF